MANGNPYHDDAPPTAHRQTPTPRPVGADLDVPPPAAPPRKRLATDPDHPPLETASRRLRAVAPARAGELRIGIIGTGRMADAHAENFAKHGCRVTSCLDIDADRAKAFAGRHRIGHVASDEDALIERCDAVAVVTPDASHARYVIRALRCNRHVLCEKPLTSSLAEARTVVQAWREAKVRGVVGMVNFSYRCASAASHAAWMRSQGMVGDLRHVSAQYAQGWLCDTHQPDDAAFWRLRRATGGGVLADLGCHLLDMVTAIAGDLKRVNCVFANHPKVAADGSPYVRWQNKALDADDTAILTVEFAAGGTGCLQLTRWASGRANTIKVDVHGTRGAMVFDLDHSYEQVHHHDVASKKWHTEYPAPAPSTWQRFIDAVRNGRADQPDLERGAQIQAYLDACRRSAEGSSWQDVERWD